MLSNMSTGKPVINVSNKIHLIPSTRHHCELYPNEKNLRGPLLLKELKEIVLHASAEAITTDLSLSPFDGDELPKILDLISQLQDNAQDEYRAHSICVIVGYALHDTSPLSSQPARAQFFKFCGLPEARLNAD
ncbi:uncharacterized protein EDB91DRAFT_512380 [Suillus paluster]|uniref:uncharacterized protein n=1 Tax=Suillus paluster TaxID=48578 RepID=UPI001B877920|nr:uncharacterized protein EDB91DRAFT_512380 [Suillus paluster]KAG1752370.1 hypothetical protein EDB91DRAFT_512380 [Suillus paluster]